MIDDINAQPDYGDEPPFACSSVAVLDGEAFACGGTPGHAGKHRYLIDWNGPCTLVALTREPQPAPELAAAMGETRKVADAANVVLDAFARGSDGWHARLSGVTLMRAYKAIGRPVPPQLSHLEGQ